MTLIRDLTIEERDKTIKQKGKYVIKHIDNSKAKYYFYEGLYDQGIKITYNDGSYEWIELGDLEDVIEYIKTGD